MPVPGIYDSVVSSTPSETEMNWELRGDMCNRFMPADSMWALTMACNVYLALFHHYNTDLLRPLEWKYFIFCYGVPFIPAFVFLFIDTKSRGKIYGPAIVRFPEPYLKIS